MYEEERFAFIKACTLKGAYSELGDSKNANKQYKKVHETYLFFKNKNRLDVLLELLNHDNPYVRLGASTYTLQIDPQRAEKTLEELLGVRRGLLGFEAQMTLQEWRKGNLKFPETY